MNPFSLFNTEEFINYLFSLGNFHKGVYKLDGILEVAATLPKPSFPIIHVAGTNGKGSVCEKIFQALKYQGYRVGLFTSPHISTFLERIRTDRGMIQLKEAIASCQEIIASYKQVGREPTFFELMTLLALLHFSKEKVDVAVFEVGLGGRLDATNIFTPIVSVITSISKDHMALLGNSLEEIGAEKAGIIKPHIPVILGPRAKIETIYAKAVSVHAPIHQVEETGMWYDEENSHIAERALIEVSKSLPLSLEAIHRGLLQRPLGRFEQLPSETIDPLKKVPANIILDVAHNEDGLIRLKRALDYHFPHAKIRLLVGMSKDKDLMTCFQLLRSWGYPIHLVSVQGTKLSSVADLHSICQALLIEQVSGTVSFEETLDEALRLSYEKGEVLVCVGSFFIMSEIKSYLGIVQDKDVISLNER